MSTILRWFHDGDVRYRAYFRTSESTPTVRQLIVASPRGEAVNVVAGDRRLEDYSHDELLEYARRLHDPTEECAQSSVMNGAAAH
jgi:hypothetical protein